MSRSISDRARATRGSLRSGMAMSSSDPDEAAAGSATPWIIAKRLISLESFREPHFGHFGPDEGFTRRERKLKIIRHWGHANS